jgi:hypothetical protein
MTATAYRETFDADAGGWWGWYDNARGYRPLEHADSSVTTRSPWWIDYNHAPPGAGYLHMLMGLHTAGAQGEAVREAGGRNRYIEGGFTTDLRDAEMRVRLRGELVRQDAHVVLLVQGTVDGITSGWALTHQPLLVDREWSDQRLRLAPDPEQWTALGSRRGREDMYGVRPLERVLADVNVNILLIMFPLTIEPMGPIDGDPHALRPERDYPVWRHRLPEGYVAVDEIEIAFP